jgi:UDP-N-acetylglucosamine--N-acetylmuramyl-(pentapeptide) pyrophosphoryl-undecaprenol N-acetylglucosamine transferase
MERELVSRDGVEFATIHAGALHGVGLARKIASAFRLAAGMFGALRIVRSFRPDVVLLTGGFVGVPVSVAAWLMRVPTVVYLPDIEPGLALRAMARLATKVATTTEASAQFLAASKMVVTGYPVRGVFYHVDRAAARARFGIASSEKVLLVVGGSKGALSINRAVTQGIADLLKLAVVIHVAGNRDWDEVRAVRERLTPAEQARYLAYPYLHEEMADAMAAADLAICRSGASSLGELPFVGLPAVLVPYPHAWRYQKVNAQYLVERGAAVMLEDAKLGDGQAGVVAVARELLGAPARLGAMRAALLGMGGRDGAGDIARLLVAVAGTKQV